MLRTYLGLADFPIGHFRRGKVWDNVCTDDPKVDISSWSSGDDLMAMWISYPPVFMHFRYLATGSSWFLGWIMLG